MLSPSSLLAFRNIATHFTDPLAAFKAAQTVIALDLCVHGTACISCIARFDWLQHPQVIPGAAASGFCWLAVLLLTARVLLRTTGACGLRDAVATAETSKRMAGSIQHRAGADIVPLVPAGKAQIASGRIHPRCRSVLPARRLNVLRDARPDPRRLVLKIAETVLQERTANT